MAVGIENYPNIDTTDPANYPKGNIKDNPGDGSGTPINVLTTADIHQTFYKILDLAGVTATGDPDNVANGYQYMDAIQSESTGAPVMGSGWSTPIAGQMPEARYYNIYANRINLTGTVVTTSGTPAATICTLPGGFRPPNSLFFSAAKYTAGTASMSIIPIRVNASGAIIIFNATDIPSGIGDYISLDGISFYTD